MTALSGIEERKRLEAALHFRQFGLDHADEAFFWIGSDARIRDANQTACRILGYSHAELLQLTVADFDPELPLEKWPAHWQALKQNKVLRFESCHRNRDGLIWPVE
ncbi:MAG: PAS domain S-box protein, partial [Deltaproteobacteria bacterium]|nr:PAS domain S-box protein [Deltaproteobacteria bacterium]